MEKTASQRSVKDSDGSSSSGNAVLTALTWERATPQGSVWVSENHKNACVSTKFIGGNPNSTLKVGALGRLITSITMGTDILTEIWWNLFTSPSPPCEDTGGEQQLWATGPLQTPTLWAPWSWTVHPSNVRNICWFFRSSTVRGIFLVIPAANGLRQRSWFVPSSSLSYCSVWVAGRPGVTWRGTDTQTSRSTNRNQ